ncbi:MAG: hypothetical protein JNK05_13290 [Myxococcales bacterium]|nr:hypothetical protein [Myxococcales bacterium]
MHLIVAVSGDGRTVGVFARTHELNPQQLADEMRPIAAQFGCTVLQGPWGLLPQDVGGGVGFGSTATFQLPHDAADVARLKNALVGEILAAGNTVTVF